MGIFLAVSGVINASAQEVQAVLQEFARTRGGGFGLIKESTDTENIGVISVKGGNTTVVYPNGFCEWDDASQFISDKLSKPVFSLHIHDGDLWMYLLFHEGKEVGKFNPMPSYWEELTPEDEATWRGDAELIARLVPNVAVDAISKYFVPWGEDSAELPKAYPNDQAPAGDCWQMCDFMDKLSLEYPLSSEGKVNGETFCLWTNEFPLESIELRKKVCFNQK